MPHILDELHHTGLFLGLSDHVGEVRISADKDGDLSSDEHIQAIMTIAEDGVHGYRVVKPKYSSLVLSI